MGGYYLRLSELINMYNLHDSLVENITFLKDELKLMFDIELCKWKQESYKDTEPEMALVKLVFSGVRKYEIKPDLEVYDSNEILEIEVSQVSDERDTEIIKIILRGDDDVRIIQIQASNVEWVNLENVQQVY